MSSLSRLIKSNRQLKHNNTRGTNMKKNMQMQAVVGREQKGRDILPSHKPAGRREAAVMERWKCLSSERETRVHYYNLPHTGSATGSGRAGHVGDKEVVVVGIKELLGLGVKRRDVVEVSG